MPSGFVDRYKGKGYQPAGWLQQVGTGGAVTPGGGQLNSTSSVSTVATGVQLSTAGTSETTLVSYSLPPKTLDRPGRNVLITAFGTFSTFNNGAKTAKLYFGSESIAVQNTTLAAATVQSWWLQLNVFQAQPASTAPAAGSQAMISQAISTPSTAPGGHQGVTFAAGAENTLALSTIKVTGISSSPTAASPGDVTVYSLQVEGLN